MAERIVTSRAPVSGEEFKEATRIVKMLGVDLRETDKKLPSISDAILLATAFWAVFTGLPALIAAGLFRGGLVLHGLGLTIVSPEGIPARRWRVLSRAVIVWLPAILATTLLPLAPLSEAVLWSLLIPLGAAYLGGAAWSLRSPQCGVQDLIARTRMVPR